MSRSNRQRVWHRTLIPRRSRPAGGPTLSVCLVTQDMAPFLPLVLDNVAPIADEIVVVDGGSHDDSLEILHAHPSVRLYERLFQGDLGDQKNYAISRARGDWVLVIDSDELLGERLVGKIPTLLQTRRITHYKFPRYWIAAGPPWRYVRSEKLYPDFTLRLFRNLPFFRYTGAVHHYLPREGRGRGRKLRRPHIFHLDFLLNDRRAREAKFRRYAEIEPRTANTSRVYLYEDSVHSIRPCRDRLREGNLVSDALHRARWVRASPAATTHPAAMSQ